MTEQTCSIPVEIEQALEGMPAISPVLGKINRMAQEMETSPRDLVKIIMLDPVLTGKVLKLVNSSFYGLTQRVQTLAQAVVYLGINTVKNLAISTALLSTVFVKERREALDLDPDDFWRHCIATALCCKFIARLNASSETDPEMYFIAGLLHDVGKVLLIRTDPQRYGLALAESRRLGVSLAFSETAHFGMSHTEAGGILARKWKLDAPLVRVIEQHHAPPQGSIQRLHGTVIIANTISKCTDAGQSGNRIIEEMADDIVSGLDLSNSAIDEVAGKIPVEVERAAEFLSFVRDQE